MENTQTLAKLVREALFRIDDIDAVDLGGLLDRVDGARVVLIGEATHGSSEFYRMRARITQELLLRRGFDFVAVEADWPDAARIDDYVRGGPRRSALQFAPFTRFPTWMWRNQEVREFMEWLRAHNLEHPQRQVAFHGLDLYSMFTSLAAVLAYLERVDPELLAVARERYGALLPWQGDPAEYGHAVLLGREQSHERAVVSLLRDMLERQLEYAQKDGERFFDALQNARLVANAERYYRTMYYGGAASWNLRDSHMFDTLRGLLAFHGPNAKGVVWAHNSHVGDANATEMVSRGEHNIGALARAAFGSDAYIIGFGTDHGTVAAAQDWDAPQQEMRVRPARADSYEGLFHATAEPAFGLHLRAPQRRALYDELAPERLERAIGVIYRPDFERASHYFYASLPRQFDEYIWFDETHALQPIAAEASSAELPDTYPFGL